MVLVRQYHIALVREFQQWSGSYLSLVLRQYSTRRRLSILLEISRHGLDAVPIGLVMFQPSRSLVRWTIEVRQLVQVEGLW